jgi:hypothetical protein
MSIIQVNARESWDRVNGNTYQSVRVWVDGQDVGTYGMTYGRDRSTALDSAVYVLRAAGFDDVPTDSPHWNKSWEDLGHVVTVDVCPIGRTKDHYVGTGCKVRAGGVHLWRVFRDGVWSWDTSGTLVA